MRRRLIALLAVLAAMPALSLPGVVHALTPGCDGKDATIVGTAADDVLVGTDADDVLVGLGGNDQIFGGLGNDTLCGFEGEDTLLGESGNDRLFGGPSLADSTRLGERDEVLGGPGDDYLDGGNLIRDPNRDDFLSFRPSTQGINLDLALHTATGEGADTIADQPWVVVGSLHDDRILGTESEDLLLGGPGDDHLDGRGGNDILVADASRYDPFMVGTDKSGDDVLIGGTGRDHLDSSAGNDHIWGGAGGDLIVSVPSPAGRITIKAGDGNDAVDLVLTDVAGQVVKGGRGRDHVGIGFRFRPGPVTADAADGRLSFRDRTAVSASFQVWTLGNGGPWTWSGTRGRDRLDAGLLTRGVRAFGRRGADALIGGSNDDLLVGGPGFDVARPRGGYDVCLGIEQVLFGVCEVRHRANDFRH